MPKYGTSLTGEEEEKPPKGPSSGQITEAIRQGFAFALLKAKVPPAIRTLLLDKATKLDDKLQNLAGKAFENTASAQQGAYYFMQEYVIPAAQNLGYDVLLGPDPGQWHITTKLVGDAKTWFANLEMALYQTKQEMAAAENLEPDPETGAVERPETFAARAAQAIRATIPEVWKAAPPPGLKEPDLVAEAYDYPARDREGIPPGYVAPGGPKTPTGEGTIGEQIAEERAKRENYTLAMKNEGYVPSVSGGWVRPGEKGSSEAEEFARQGRGATFRAAVPMIKAGQTAADERLAKRAQEERIAAQVAPSSVARSWAAPASLASYTGTVPKEMTAREAFEVGRGNLGALEALASGGREAYESALLGSNIKEKFGAGRLRSEFPTPSAGYETRGMESRANAERQAAAQPWLTRRLAEPLAAQFPKEWEEYAAPRTYGWEKGAKHVAASQFTPEEPFDMPFEDFVKKRRTPLAAPTVRGRSIFRFPR